METEEIKKLKKDIQYLEKLTTLQNIALVVVAIAIVIIFSVLIKNRL